MHQNPASVHGASSFIPPGLLRNGLLMTLYAGLVMPYRWQRSTPQPEPPYRPHRFYGADQVPIHGLWACPDRPRGTLIGTYGITGDLENQWFLRVLGRKAYGQNLAVVIFDWRAHGKTAQLSPVLTSDGLYEGADFVHIAQQALALGCPAPVWFAGFSLGGQLALWGLEAIAQTAPAIGLNPETIGGAIAICPSLDSNRSLAYLEQDPLGKYIERAITGNLQRLAWQIQAYHPGSFDPEAIARIHSIRSFDRELVIPRLGFGSLEAYYAASSPLPWLPKLQRPALVIYAEDDPLFAPEIIAEVRAIARTTSCLDLLLTPNGGHV
ncbi:esterase, partial [filamentous cyanobacterium CCP5]